MSMLRFRLQNIAQSLPRTVRWMGEHPFLGFLILLSFALLISGSVFYQYVFTLKGDVPSDMVIQSRFDQQKFQEVVQIWQERGEKFNQSGAFHGKNIFASPVD